MQNASQFPKFVSQIDSLFQNDRTRARGLSLIGQLLATCVLALGSLAWAADPNCEAHSIVCNRYSVISLGLTGYFVGAVGEKPRPAINRSDRPGIPGFVAGVAPDPITGLTGPVRAYAAFVEEGKPADIRLVEPAPIAGFNSYSSGMAINSFGGMAGFTSATPIQGPFVASFGGAAQVVPPLFPNTPSVNLRVAYGINDAGTFVGEWERTAFISEGGSLARLLPPSFVMDFGFPNTAFDVNDHGWAVGYGYNLQFKQQAFLWKGGSRATLLQYLPNNDWNPDSRAYAINNANQVVGVSSTAPKNNTPVVNHAAIWAPDGTVTSLGSLGQDPYQKQSVAYAINDLGLVVGQSWCASGNSVFCGFIWAREHGHMLDLNDLLLPNYKNDGWRIVAATGISNLGVIAAQATPPGSTISYDVLLIPERLEDMDQDGIPDDWEKNGIPLADGTRDMSLLTSGMDPPLSAALSNPRGCLLPGPGPDCKDIFIWYDWIEGTFKGNVFTMPTQKSLDDIRRAFLAKGFRVHFRRGSALPNCSKNEYRFETTLAECLNEAKAASFLNYLSPGQDTPQRSAKPDRLFHYLLFVDTFLDVNGPHAGVTPDLGKDFLVASGVIQRRAHLLGTCTNASPTDVKSDAEWRISETVMHELGHALGLGHGGVKPRGFGRLENDDVNYKPNHLSVMNYLYMSGNLKWRGQKILDYSSFDSSTISALDERNLNETTGLTVGSSVLWKDYDIFALRQRTHSCTELLPDNYANQVRSYNSVIPGIDWNGDGNYSASVTVPLGEKQQFIALPFERLGTNNEWEALNLRNGGIGGYAGNIQAYPAGVQLGKSDIPENVLVPSSTPRIIGDLNGDGSVDLRDLNILNSNLNKRVANSTCGSECDLDNDGTITALDSRRLMLLCTRPRCALP